jgi:hypothetical protein
MISKSAAFGFSLPSTFGGSADSHAAARKKLPEKEALGLLGDAPDDVPSQVLAARCRRLRGDPPPVDWNGVFVAREK